MNSRHKIIKKVENAYNSIAEEFDRTRRIAWRDFALFLPYIKKGMRVLDAGCGNGRLYEYLQRREIRYIGIDIAEELIKIAKQRYPEIEFNVEDITEIDYETGSFDAIFCIATLHHVPGKKLRMKVLQKMHHALKPKGILILTVWNLWQKGFWWPWLKTIITCMLTVGVARRWNDLWIRWSKGRVKRYFHAFTMRELKELLNKEHWLIEKTLFTQNGNPVGHNKAHNIVMIALKK